MVNFLREYWRELLLAAFTVLIVCAGVSGETLLAADRKACEERGGISVKGRSEQFCLKKDAVLP